MLPETPDTAPLRRPARLGEPCWTPESAAAAIGGVAQVDRARSHFFLASHAPIRHLEDASTGSPISEEEVYRRLANTAKAETLVMLKGGPGTGKSHLVNWLKLRFDAGAAAGERRVGKVLSVLVQRRSGSLRDALEQILAQLPEAFHAYLDPVRSAIARITEDEARHKLAAAMHLELGVRWTSDRRAQELPRDLRHLAEAFRSDGFTTWLCREGGAIDLSIRRLVDPSDARDREDAPRFTAADFIVSNPRLAARDRNTLNVVNLVEALLDDPDYAPRAAEVCDGVLRAALSEITGLGNARLVEIFNRIRGDLKAQGYSLAVFIEDVSTLSVLDAEVVNALEPQNDSSLCDLVSVVGMTEGAFGALRTNQRQRASLVLSLGNAQTTTWRDDPDDVARFVARYMNTARLDEGAVRAVAAGRTLPGSEVTLSACDRCPVIQECHATFGAVELGGDRDGETGTTVAVGLFPFSAQAPHRLLSNLDDQGQDRIEKTPRGLLDFVVSPVLAMMEALEAGIPARPNLPLRAYEPLYWTGFRETYAGGWRSEETARVKFLAGAWIDAGVAPVAAACLKPLLDPFRLPRFTAEVKAVPTVGAGGGTDGPGTRVGPGGTPRQGGTQPVSRTGGTPTLDKRIPELAARLEEWVVGGKTLQTPRDVQALLLDLVRNALPFEDRRGLPNAAREAVVRNRITIIRLEDAATRAPNERFFIDFPRTDETRDLVLALAHQAYQGRGSWDYEPDAERHKRTVGRWLRRHQDRLMGTVDPLGLDVAAPVSAALGVLAVAALVERRSDLPSDTPAAVEALLRKGGDRTLPVPVSDALGRLYKDLPERRRLAREFLLSELDVPQGGGGCNFIDPLPIVERLPRLRAALEVEALPPEYHGGYWQTRYEGLSGLAAWNGLGDAVAAERESLDDCLSDIRRGLAVEGYVDEDSKIGDLYAQLMRDLSTLAQVQKETRQGTPHTEFERLFRDDPATGGPNRKTTLAAAVRDAAAAVAVGGDRAVLTFDPTALLEARRVLRVTSDYLATVRREVGAKLQRIGEEGDYDALLKRLTNALDVLVGATPSSAASGADAAEDPSAEEADDVQAA